MMENQKEEITPDELLESFRGRSMKSIIIFSVVVHAVLLLGTSLPYLYQSVAGADTAGLSEQERIDKAFQEASASLRKIADQHGLKPQDLSSRLADGRPKATAALTTADAAEPAATPAAVPEADKPLSTIEKEIGKVEEGPTLPPVEEEEDLFK
jgi:hypothetical protein